MRITNIGILLLIASLLIKFSIDKVSSLNKSNSQIDNVSLLIPEISPLKFNSLHERNLLAVSAELKTAIPKQNITGQNRELLHKTEAPKNIPMNFVQELVHFDSEKPIISEIKTTYKDEYDIAQPLDNGNTLVSELLLMMPKR